MNQKKPIWKPRIIFEQPKMETPIIKIDKNINEEEEFKKRLIDAINSIKK